jgi:serine/threonine protein kinase
MQTLMRIQPGFWPWSDWRTAAYQAINGFKAKFAACSTFNKLVQDLKCCRVMKSAVSFNSSASYRFIRRIGSGGSADVLLYGKRSGDLPEQEVVLKVLKPRSSEALSELINEGRRLSKLKHPHIVATFGYEKVDRNSFGLVMEYIPGENLREVSPRLPHHKRHAMASYVIGVLCDALAAAFDQGIVHGDVSARNVLISEQGMIKLTDFGLSRRLGTRGLSYFSKKGSADYLAPERWRGAQSAHHSDVFAVGVIAYELLTGSNPLQAASLSESEEALKTFLDQKSWRRIPAWSQFFEDVFHEDSRFRPTARDLVSRLPDVGLEAFEVQKILASHVLLHEAAAESANRTQTAVFFNSFSKFRIGQSSLFGRRQSPFSALQSPVLLRCLGFVIFFLGLCTSHATGGDYTLSGRLRPFLMTVTSNPWGEIRIDGGPVGYTPLINVPVSAGVHEIYWKPKRGPGLKRSLTAFDNGLVAFQVVEQKGRPLRIALIHTNE